MTASTLSELLRYALGCSSGSLDLSAVTASEWCGVVDMSFEQGVPAIAVDGYHKYLSSHPGAVLAIEKEEIEAVKYEWIGSSLQMEVDYDNYILRLNKLCRFYSDHGLKPVLLKGIGLGLDYPVPEHRPVGDIDIFLDGGRSLEGDRLIQEHSGIKVVKSRLGHHSHFVYKGLSVENHYELSNSYFGKERARRLEEALRELISEGIWKPSEDCPYYLPSANFNAIFLIWHMNAHFKAEQIILRQLCDWLMFLKKYHSGIDWTKVRRIWAEAGLESFADAIGAVMVKYFNMPEEWMPGLSTDDRLAERIMDDIIFPDKRKGSGLVNAGRYFKQAWKYRLTPGSNWFLAMLESAWLHIAHKEDMEEKEVI